jgi:hypothetical protein
MRKNKRDIIREVDIEINKLAKHLGLDISFVEVKGGET